MRFVVRKREIEGRMTHWLEPCDRGAQVHAKKATFRDRQAFQLAALNPDDLPIGSVIEVTTPNEFVG